MKNKTILITGANGGIAQAFIKKYAPNNTIIALGRNLESLTILQNTFPKIHIICCDLGDFSQREACFHDIVGRFPKINMIVNNAGIQNNYYEQDFFGMTGDNFDTSLQEIEINFTAVTHLCFACIPTLIKNQGSIVNISSALGFVPKKSSPIYNATKAAIHIFTKSLRYQLQEKGIEVYEIIPSLIDTKMTKGRGKGKISPEELIEEFEKNYHKKNYEINIGKVKILRLLQRIFPKIADNILKNS